MCILLYVKLMWCSSIPYIYGQLRGALVYMHSAICETFVVKWYTIHLWSIGGGKSAWSICAFSYMWNLFDVVVYHTSMINWRGGFGIYALCYMWNFCGVAVYHTSMVNWRGRYICPKYMCILLYLKVMQCSGIP